MSAGDEGERLLVEAAIGGDRDAFAALYRENLPVVFKFVRFRVGDALAEDVTAETFCRAYASLRRYEWRGVPFRAWLLRIAYNIVVSESRRRSSSEILVDDIEVVAPGAGDDFLAALRVQELRDLLFGLAPAQAAAVDLRFLRDLSVADTAVVMDISEEAVRALTYRALRALRRRLVADQA